MPFLSHFHRGTTTRISALSAACAAASVLIACGGGGGGGTNGDTPSTGISLSGVAATGSPMAGATLRVYDRTGAVVCTTTASATGAYTCALAGSAQGPFVVTATPDDHTLVSATASAASGTVNVTPITHLIAARLSSNGDPAQLPTTAATLTASQVTAKVAEITAMLQPLLTAVGDTTHPISGTFTANGSAHDQALDSLQVSVRPVAAANGVVQSANVDITVKTLPATAEAPPVQVSFNTAATSVAAIPAVSASALVAADVAAQMQGLMTRLGTCYALPLAERVSGNNVVAAACRALFAGDEPSNYLNSSHRVGPNGDFSGMFTNGGNGTTFDRPTFEFLRTNGDVVMNYRWTTPAGNSDTARVVVVKQNNVYKLIGNQNAYSGAVKAFVQKRDYVRAAAYSHLSTGYNVIIANQLDSSAQPLFARVVVTTPRNTSFTYCPTAGQANLQLARDYTTNGCSNPYGTSVMRLAAAYESASTSGNPAAIEVNLAYAATPWTDSELANLGDQSLWKFDYYLASAPTVLAATQYFRTASRAPTLAEARAMRWATPLPTARTALIANASAGYLSFPSAPTSTAPNELALNVAGGDWWTVPAGAQSPTAVVAYGAMGVNGTRFDDRVQVASTARATTVRCSRQSSADLHCDSTLQSSFAQGAIVHSIELASQTQKQLQLSSMLATYRHASMTLN